MKKLTLILLAVFVLAAVAYLFTSSSKQETITLVATDSGWDSQKFHNELAKMVLEHAFDGYELTFSTASSNMNWQALVAGDIDLSIECWTENMVTYQQDKANGDIVDVGVVVPNSAQGFYVPRYVIEGDEAAGVAPLAPDLRHVRDLKKYAKVFPDDERQEKGRIFGAIPGWTTDRILFKKYQHYGLEDDYVYMRLGSEAAIFTAIEAAYNLKQPWVGYCYEPTWVTGKLDLVRLEDEPYDETDFLEGKTEFPQQKLKIVSSRKFRDKVSPEVYSFFQNYRTGSAEVSSALAYLSEHRVTHIETVVWFLKSNDGVIDEWLPEENADKLRKYLRTIK